MGGAAFFETRAFLISDSRSGSTLLAREMQARLQGVLVTQELGLDALLSAPQSASTEELCRRLAMVLVQPNIAANLADIEQCLVAARQGDQPGASSGRIGRLVDLALAAWWNKCPRPTRPSVLVIKNGSHSRFIRRLAAEFATDVRYIFLVRDPRAVVTSKLQNRRPYAPWEAMAWGGPGIAAWRWRQVAQCSRVARRLGLTTLEVKYEALIADPDKSIESIGRLLGVAVKTRIGPANYQVPEPERGIHGLALRSGIVGTQVDAWRGILPERSCKIVEALCRPEMLERAYLPDHPMGSLERACILCAEVPRAMAGVLRHYAMRFRHRKANMR